MTPEPLPRLLLLHGFTGSPASWADVLAAQPAGSERAVLAPALVGHRGACPDSIAVARFEDELDRLAELTRDQPPLHVAGYSLGGRLALGLLVRHPDRFTGATLIGTHPGLASEAERAARRADDERWCARLEGHGIAAFVDAWERLPLFASQAEVVPAERLAAQRRERLSHDAAGLARSLRATGLGAMPCWRDALADVRVPVRLLAGALDTKFTALGRQMAAALPRATLEVVPGAGHNLLLERPDLVAAALFEENPT